MTASGSEEHGASGGRLRALGLGIVLTVALLGAAEGLLRLAWPDLEVDGAIPAFPEVFDHLDNVHHERDPDLMWRLRAGYEEGGVRIGETGFRGPIGTRDPDTWRVAAMGDSVTFGYSNPRYEDTWPAQLEARLVAACGERARVLDAGVTGYSSEQGRRLYRRRVAGAEPDVVILLYGYNDHHLSGLSDREKLEAGGGSAVLERLRELSLARALRKLAFEGGDVAIERPLRPRVPLDRFRENLRTLVLEVRADGATPILVTIPTRPGIPLVENPIRVARSGGGERWTSPIRWLERRLPPGSGDVLLALVFTGAPPDPAWLRGVASQIERAVDAAPEQPLPRFLRGLVRHARGDGEGARADFDAALALDAERRSVGDYNAAILEVARELDAPAVDLAGALVLGERPGEPTSFHDVVHLTTRGNAIAAAALAPRVAEALGCVFPASPE